MTYIETNHDHNVLSPARDHFDNGNTFMVCFAVGLQFVGLVSPLPLGLSGCSEKRNKTRTYFVNLNPEGTHLGQILCTKSLLFATLVCHFSKPVIRNQAH